jgi:hypothetical protein
MTRDPPSTIPRHFFTRWSFNVNTSPARPTRTSAINWISARLGSAPDRTTLSCQRNVPAPKRRALSLLRTQPHQQRIQAPSQNSKLNLNSDFVQPEF